MSHLASPRHNHPPTRPASPAYSRVRNHLQSHLQSHYSLVEPSTEPSSQSLLHSPPIDFSSQPSSRPSSESLTRILVSPNNSRLPALKAKAYLKPSSQVSTRLVEPSSQPSHVPTAMPSVKLPVNPVRIHLLWLNNYHIRVKFPRRCLRPSLPVSPVSSIDHAFGGTIVTAKSSAHGDVSGQAFQSAQ